MTKKQLHALLLIIKGVNSLRSDYTDKLFTEVMRRENDDLFNKLEIVCPFKDQAWQLALFIDDNTIAHCSIDDSKITFD